MHCQKSGRDKQTSAAVRYRLWFGAGLFLINFSVILLSYFFLAFPPGGTSIEYPALRQCKTLASIIAHQQHLNPGRLGFFRELWCGRTISDNGLTFRCRKIIWPAPQQHWTSATVGSVTVFGSQSFGFEGLQLSKFLMELQMPTAHLQNTGWRKGISAMYLCGSLVLNWPVSKNIVL